MIKELVNGSLVSVIVPSLGVVSEFHTELFAVLIEAFLPIFSIVGAVLGVVIDHHHTHHFLIEIIVDFVGEVPDVQGQQLLRLRLVSLHLHMLPGALDGCLNVNVVGVGDLAFGLVFALILHVFYLVL